MESEIYLHLLDVGPFSIKDLESLNSDIKFLERQFSSINGLRKMHLKGNPPSTKYFIEDTFDNSLTPIYSKYTQEELRELKAIHEENREIKLCASRRLNNYIS